MPCQRDFEAPLDALSSLSGRCRARHARPGAEDVDYFSRHVYFPLLTGPAENALVLRHHYFWPRSEYAAMIF